MPGTLRHFQLRAYHRVVKRRGYLADAAAHTVHSLSVQIRSRHVIPVRRSKGAHRLISGEGVARIQHCAVDQLCSPGNISGAVAVRRLIACGIGAELILNLAQLLFCAAGLIDFHRKIDASLYVIPLIFNIIQNGLHRAVHIQQKAFLARHVGKGAAILLKRGVHRFLIKLGTFAVHILCNQIGIQRPLQLIIFILMLQILAVLVALNNISGLSKLNRFFHHIHIRAA